VLARGGSSEGDGVVEVAEGDSKCKEAAFRVAVDVANIVAMDAVSTYDV